MATRSSSRHTETLARWGKVWKWHSATTFLLLAAVNVMTWFDVTSFGPYLVLAFIGLPALGLPIRIYRFRTGVPLTPIERQFGPVWYLFGATALLTYLLGHAMGLTIVRVIPIVFLECGFAFGCMAAILGGSFYPLAGGCAVVTFAAFLPAVGPLVAGIVFAIGLWIPATRCAAKGAER